MRKFVGIIGLFIGLSSASGQDIELLGVEYSRYPSAAVTSSDSLEANFTEYEVRLQFPAIKKEKFSLLIGGTYRLVTPDSDAGTFESNLYFLSTNFVGAYSLSDNQQLIIGVVPAISTTTNARGFTSDNYLMQGALLYRKKVSERFSYSFGVLSTSRFGAPIILPSLGMSHEGEKMKLDINLPLLIQSMWNYQNAFSYGLKLSVNGSQYNFEEESFNGSEVNLARFSRVRLGPQLQCVIKGPLVFTLYGGIAANRTYEFELNGADDLDFSLDNGPFVSFRLSLNPQLKNK